jgi:hypothetical protein
MLRFCGLALLAATQVAWTGYQTDSGKRVYWPVTEIPMVADMAGTVDVAGDAEFAIIQKSMATWNVVTCQHPKLVWGGLVTGLKANAGKQGKGCGEDDDCTDGTNLFIFEDKATWLAEHPVGMEKVIALTTLYYDSGNGVAQEADMEFSDWAFNFTATNEPGKIGTDLENTLTHELGHVLGLDHSEDSDATMYYSAASGDISKRTLGPDDITGLCMIYKDIKPVEPKPDTGPGDPDGSGGGGCETCEGRMGPAGWILLAGGVVWLGFRVRRQSKSE